MRGFLHLIAFAALFVPAFAQGTPQAAERVAVSATTDAAPKEAQKARQSGGKALVDGNFEKAAKDLETAVSFYSNYAEAWLDLGRARLGLKQYEFAQDAWKHAIFADPKFVEPYQQLGILQAQLQKWDEARVNLDKALQLNPACPPLIWHVDAIANLNTQHLEIAATRAREAIRLDPQHSNPRSIYILGLALGQNDRGPEAAEQLQTFLSLVPNAPDAVTIRQQIAQFQSQTSAAR